MKIPRLLIQTFTLSCFVVLMGSFVAYRSGTFDSKQLKPDSSLVKGLVKKDSALDSAWERIYKDTIRVDSTEAMYVPKPGSSFMSSSKSSYILSPRDLYPQVAHHYLVKKSKNNFLTDRVEKVIMSSSKSALIFHPGQIPFPFTKGPLFQKTK